jgi:outer membrane receptor protein involved in Fe transport
MQFVNPDSVYMHAYSLYAQHQSQVSRKLTVNFGLRWGWYPFPTRDHGGVSRFDPADGNIYIGGHGNVPVDTGAISRPGESPRFGIAYRLTEKTIIRSGFGLSAPSLKAAVFAHMVNSATPCITGLRRSQPFGALLRTTKSQRASTPKWR